MNAAEVLQVCRLVKALCPSQMFDEFTADAWALVIGRCDYADAKTAIGELVSVPLEPGKSRYIEPGHIIGGINRIRGRRLEATPIPAPPAELETPAEQIEWQRQAREQIARGTFVAPDGPKQIARIPEGSWRDLLPSVTTYKPGVAAAEGRKFRADPEQRAAIDDEAAERERQRQLAALEAITEPTETEGASA